MQERGPHALPRSPENVHRPTYEVMQQIGAEAFFTGGAEEFLHEIPYKLDESQDFKQNLVHHLIKQSTFTVSVTCYFKQQT